MPILQSPLPWPVIQIVCKQAKVAVERVLHVGANAERGKDRGQKQQRMQPVTPFRRMNYNDRYLPSFRIKDVIFLRKRLDVRHETNSPVELKSCRVGKRINCFSRWTATPFPA